MNIIPWKNQRHSKQSYAGEIVEKMPKGFLMGIHGAVYEAINLWFSK